MVSGKGTDSRKHKCFSGGLEGGVMSNFATCVS